jgi:hypothetical protein
MLYLKAPNPDRFLPWKIGESVQHPGDFYRAANGTFIPADVVILDPLILDLIQRPFLTTHPPMSRKFDRRRQIESAALQTLKASVRQKPRWLPMFLWKPLVWTASRILFK